MPLMPSAASAASASPVKSTAPAFEDVEDIPSTPVAQAAAPAAPAPAAAAAPAPVDVVPVAAPVSALAVARPAGMIVGLDPASRVIDSLKDSMRVDWNTLERIKPTQGQFFIGDVSLGDIIDFELMSYQDNWVCSPGDNDPASKELVRYSDDGQRTREGDDIHAYCRSLVAQGKKNAKVSQRCIIAGELLGSIKTDKFDGDLGQLDLPPTSKANFDRYRLRSTKDVQKGIAQPQQVLRIRLTADVAKNGTNTYTVVKFSQLP